MYVTNSKVGKLGFFTITVATLLSQSLALSISSSAPIDIDLSGDPASDVITPLVVYNNSLTLTNTTTPQYDIFPATTNAFVQCNSGRYGVNLDRSACLDAVAKIGNDPTQFTVAQRGLGRRPAVALPNRWVSCEYAQSSAFYRKATPTLPL